jgi:hypothetical protein
MAWNGLEKKFQGTYMVSDDESEFLDDSPLLHPTQKHVYGLEKNSKGLTWSRMMIGR